MSGLKHVPLFGAGTESLFSIISKQRCVNVYKDIRKDGNKSNIIYRGTAGLTFYTSLPVSPARANPIDYNGQLFVVYGNHLYLVSQIGGYINCGSFGNLNATGTVTMAFNSTQLGLADGTGFYIFKPSTQIGTVNLAAMEAAVDRLATLNKIAQAVTI